MLAGNGKFGSKKFPLILGDKIQMVKFSISLFLVESLIKNPLNSRTSYDIDVKIRPLSKLDKGDTLIPEILMKTSSQQVINSLLFFSILASFLAVQNPEFGCMTRSLNFFLANYLFV